jgi:ferredoxin
MELMPKDERKGADIFKLLTETARNEKKKRKSEFLTPLDISEYFPEGSITINEKTCQGVECKLCIKACPTNALFWRAGEVGMTEDLCIYCGACVLSCIVDNCIRITRKRASGEVERFSSPRQFMNLQNKINAEKRLQRIDEVKELLPSPEGFQKRKKAGKKK